MSTIQLARGERLNEEAQAELAAARDLARQNTERLNDARRKMHFITERRVSGTVTAAEAAEYAALQGDEALLGKMLDAAKQYEIRATEKVHGAFVFYTDAKAAHDRELAQAKFKALQEHCRQIEAVFIQCLGEVGRAGQAIGISTMGSAYPKSNAIRQVFDLNMTPTEGA